MLRHQAIGGDPDPGLAMGLGQHLLKGGVVRRIPLFALNPLPRVRVVKSVTWGAYAKSGQSAKHAKISRASSSTAYVAPG